MTAIFDVRTDTLLQAAAQLEKAIQEFESAVNQVKAATEMVCSYWEGDVKVEFETQHDKKMQWYSQMSAAARTGVEILKQIAQTYQEADEEAASKIRS